MLSLKLLIVLTTVKIDRKKFGNCNHKCQLLFGRSPTSTFTNKKIWKDFGVQNSTTQKNASLLLSHPISNEKSKTSSVMFGRSFGHCVPAVQNMFAKWPYSLTGQSLAFRKVCQKGILVNL